MNRWGSYFTRRPADFWRIPEHTGLPYHACLKIIHESLRPKSYLEIGTLAGATLRVARCHSIAIDPKFQIDGDVVGEKPSCNLFQVTSDEFFQCWSPKDILGRPIDVAFLDGFHQFEFLLRDFINVEAHCSRKSVILMHDCIPTDAHIARRSVEDRTYARLSRHPGWWAGDVWKVVAILKKFRPTLGLSAFGAPPTGLIAVTNLDPTCHVLRDNYSDVISLFSDEDNPGSFIRSLDILRTDKLLEQLMISRPDLD